MSLYLQFPLCSLVSGLVRLNCHWKWVGVRMCVRQWWTDITSRVYKEVAEDGDEF